MSEAAYEQAVAFCRPNWLKNHMKEKKLGFSFGLAVTHSADVVHLAKFAGFTAILMNMEHNRADIGVAADMCNAALNLGISPICVVPSCESMWVSRMLDNGAQGIICPRVNDVAMTRKFVEYSKFRPVGKRPLSWCAQMQYQMPNMKSVMEVLNDNTLTIPMIETLEGLECCEEIAKVPGVDMLFCGAFDLSDEMGIPAEYDQPRLQEGLHRVCKAAQAAGIYVGFGGLEWRHDLIAKFRKEYPGVVGYVMAARDLAVLQAGMKEVCQTMQAL